MCVGVVYCVGYGVSLALPYEKPLLCVKCVMCVIVAVWHTWHTLAPVCVVWSCVP